MKLILLSTVLLSASLCFAVEPPAAPTLNGTWNLVERSCSSNSVPKDGMKIGTDTMAITNNNDKTFTSRATLGGCETVMNGTYTVDGMLVTYTAMSSQSCKDVAPVPMSESHSLFFAYLSDAEAVAISTDAKAEISCPPGDALVLRFQKVQPAE